MNAAKIFFHTVVHLLPTEVLRFLQKVPFIQTQFMKQQHKSILLQMDKPEIQTFELNKLTSYWCGKTNIHLHFPLHL